MGIETVFGRRLGTSEIVTFEHDPAAGNSYGRRSVSRDDVLSAHHQRISSEADVVVAPERSDIGGRHMGVRAYIFSDNVSTHALSTMFHELWHYAENYLLSQRDCECVYSMCRSGDTWGCGYLDSDIERAARAFQYYAGARAAGLQLRPAKKGTAQAVFERLYEGREYKNNLKQRRAQKYASLRKEAFGAAPVTVVLAGFFWAWFAFG